MDFLRSIVMLTILIVLFGIEDTQNKTIQQQKTLIRQMTHNPSCMVDDPSTLKR